MHPVTRLGRVIQQLRSFGDLHAGELEGMAQTLDTLGQWDVASQLRQYRDIQRDEAQMVVDELLDLQRDMAAAEPSPGVPSPAASGEPGAPAAAAGEAVPGDPAINSPRRAKWLAEEAARQAAEAERLRAPLSRRDLFGRATRPPEDAGQ